MSVPSIILFRSKQPEDAFEAAFQDAGWDARSIPVLAFRYKNKSELKAKLFSAENYSGIIVTSPRAGDLLGQLLHNDVTLQKVWLEKTTVCIGNRTAAKLKGRQLNLLISEKADSKAVGKLVIDLKTNKPWLFLCGNLRRDELPALLAEACVAFEEIQVYETNIEKNINLDEEKAPDWVVFFSPSGVQAVQKIWPSNWTETRKAVIGSTTGSALKAAGWRVDSESPRPTPDALLASILAADHKSKTIS